MKQTVDSVVERIVLHQFEGTTCVACALVLKGGHVVVGISKDQPTTSMGALRARDDANHQVSEMLAFAYSQAG